MVRVERLKLPVSGATEADQFVFDFLRNGASRDMNVDGTTPVNFDFVATADTNVERIMFFIEDGNIAPSKFGGVSALATGCLLKVLDTDGTTVIKDFLDGETITTHPEFSLLAGVDIQPDAGAGDDVVPIRWTISKAGAKLLLLTDQRVRFTVQDDLTGLTKFYALLQGTLA
jgi:hypothetical protein